MSSYWEYDRFGKIWAQYHLIRPVQPSDAQMEKLKLRDLTSSSVTVSSPPHQSPKDPMYAAETAGRAGDVTEPSTIDRCVNGMEVLVERLARVNGRLIAKNMHLLGPEGGLDKTGDPRKSAPTPPVSGSLNALDRIIGAAHSLATEIEQQQDRMERV